MFQLQLTPSASLHRCDIYSSWIISMWLSYSYEDWNIKDLWFNIPMWKKNKWERKWRLNKIAHVQTSLSVSHRHFLAHPAAPLHPLPHYSLLQASQWKSIPKILDVPHKSGRHLWKWRHVHLYISIWCSKISISQIKCLKKQINSLFLLKVKVLFTSISSDSCKPDAVGWRSHGGALQSACSHTHQRQTTFQFSQIRCHGFSFFFFEVWGGVCVSWVHTCWAAAVRGDTERPSEWRQKWEAEWEVTATEKFNTSAELCSKKRQNEETCSAFHRFCSLFPWFASK